ncbi:hypothetical protein EIP91_007250 [Steccherinum ochraceum]|uniref:WSC domain-containing protein n=1 Tax=Steccherinum ochraceum TaxID=92696 RepID=A0A4R0R4J6_9APHY|nr:hypothetical protein EIP91_007250 [Steccherinum ochraceum]
MLRLLALAVTFGFLSLTTNASTVVCRLVCPDTLDGQTLTSENNGLCTWEGANLPPLSGGIDFSTGLLAFPDGAGPFEDSNISALNLCATVSDGWDWFDSTNQVCFVDNVISRLLQADQDVPVPDNSPETCTAACEALGYSFAGVEFGAECHCGTGLTEPPQPQPVPHNECNMTCTGSDNETCGGPDRIQIFAGLTPPAAVLPSGWSLTILCAQDSAARMFTDTLIAGQALAATDTPAACTAFCAERGFTKAGVEGGDECYCGTAFREPPTEITFDHCLLPCQGAPALSCGGMFAIQLYELGGTP